MKTTNANRKLDKLFFCPKTKDLLPIIAKGIQNEKLQWFGTSHVWDAMNWLVMERAPLIDGEIRLEHLYEGVKDVARIYEMARFFKNLSPRNFGEGTVDARAESEETLIAVGVLNADYRDADDDPYQTAGGYRTWVATKGTEVRYYMNADLSIRLVFDSNCVVDHYNNNSCGVSTDGGTRNYEIGERVEKRSVTLGREAFDKNWKKADIDATPAKIDHAKCKRLASELVPEFAFLFAGPGQQI